MKIKHISRILLFLLILNLPYAFVACSNNNVIVEIDDSELTLEDFLYDIYLIQQEREVWNYNYKERLGIDYWDYEFEGKKMEQLAKETIMTRVILSEVLSNQARKEGYTLSKEELTLTEDNIDKTLESMSETQLNETGMNRDVLIKTFNKLALGNKYYLDVIDGYKVDEEAIQSSINPDEYREYITECLYVPTALVSQQKINPLSEDELDKAYDLILSIKDMVLSGADFNEVLEQTMDATYYERSFIPSDNTAEYEYKEAAMSLDNGDYSDIITTKFGLYIIHMLDNNSTKRYENAIESAIIEEKTNQFQINYDKLLQEYNISINSEKWDSLELDSIF